ncbi:endonuclease/exonuclease/phosphatase family protein [Candidatus Woesearchaeota archaeon]|nr:endonuclease/exonuclease/phosphatase family protein [Candidatus Woesearchaeota archaeon]USN44676.1 MAG: endonuclease/exonuclease/phosphatase family protein [Candidatus Woesearchaeota archaeon]
MKKHKILLYNVEYCEGMKGRFLEYLKFWRTFHAPAEITSSLVNMIKSFSPEVLGLIEVDSGSVRSGGQSICRRLSRELGMKGYFEHVKYGERSWKKLLHYVPILNKQSNALLALHPFEETKVEFVRCGVKQAVLCAKVRLGGRDVLFYLVHLSLSAAARKKQLLDLAHIIEFGRGNYPVVLMGDFNTFGGADELDIFLKITGLDLFSRFPTQPAFRPTRQLDYILTSRDIEILEYASLPVQYSDHLPVMMEFVFRDS